MVSSLFYLRPKKEVNTEYKVKKSIFIGHIFIVQKQEHARKKILEVSELHKQATHNCWAFKCEYPNSVEASSDDGEPSGTAGAPILGVINKNFLNNTLVIVTRYFGGIKLGIRGLIDAYKTTAELVLEEAGITKTYPVWNLTVKTDYQNHSRVNHSFKTVTLDGVAPKSEFKAQVTITYTIPLDMIEEAENLSKKLLFLKIVDSYSWNN